MADKELSLEQSLEAYRVWHTPTELSWKQHYVNEVFSKDNILECPKDERLRFIPRLDECKITICNSIKARSGSVCTVKNLINTLVDKRYMNIPKISRKVFYSTENGARPIGDNAFAIWSGFQVIDMDIKDEVIANKLKVALFDRLKKFNWFIGITLSSSKKGLHVYTKIQLPEKDGEINRKTLFYANFRHKYSFVYLACLKLQDEVGFTSEQLLQWMDLAMFKPQQGAFIGYDAHPLINSHFFEDFIYVNFDNIEDTGYDGMDWVTHPDLKEVFKRWEWFASNEQTDMKIEVVDAKPLEFDSKSKYHYKHNERWRLANTLVKLYGFENGYKYLRMICTNDIKDKELQSDCITASRHQKPVDVWAVNKLNTYHGFKIKLNVSTGDNKDCMERIADSIGHIDNPTLILESKNYKEFHIRKDEYLGNIKYNLLKNLGQITLIEAGAGVGKTEMVKSLVRDGKKVLLVMPFTSTIKSKVENVKDWYYAYGNKKVRLDAAPGIAMTIDKFSHLNWMEIKECGFDYIIIDESHLLFQSEYRPVMPKVIEMISNADLPIILMSGTPVGETVFFPDLMHLKVIKDDNRKKEFNVVIVNSPSEQMYHMCYAMASDIVNGRRVLFPTNNGTLFKDKLERGVKFILESEFAYYDDIVVNYYKKSNVGEKFMDDVNIDKTISDTNILLCTTYLSVGVDILDRYQFNVYLSELWMPQEVEQFANRLRSNDLYINLFIAENAADGSSNLLHSFKPLNMKLYDDEKKDAISILQLCNAMIKRNPVEYKYNSLISSIINENKFVEYNDVNNEYFLNEIAYKVIYFERKYREYVQQLPVLAKGMIGYGYVYRSRNLVGNTPSAVTFEEFSESLKLAASESKNTSAKSVDELLDVITEDRLDIYRGVLKGEYEIKKGNEWKDDSASKIMTVKNAEVFEKVVPLFVSMSKMFTVEDVKDIFKFCKKGNLYNFAAIKRVRTLINMVYNNKRNRLDLPMKDFMQKTYDFVEEKEKRSMKDITLFISKFVLNYAMKESSDGVKINMSPITMETMTNSLTNIFKCLVNMKRSKNTVMLSRAELFWKERESDEDVINKSFVFSDFLDNLVITTDTVSFENSDE